MNLTELLNKQEDLHPDLVPYMYKGRFGMTIHHPLIIELMVSPQLYALINERYKVKLEAIEKAKKEGRWHSYVYLHERPYRLKALMEAFRLGLSGTAWWNMVSDVWTDTENFWQNQDTWKAIWSDPMIEREALMTEEELKKLDELPDVVDVWRGTNYKKAARGLSWTLNKDRAKWFAKRFLRKNGKPYLVHGQVKKADIKAVFLGRNEEEIVTNKVDIKQVEELK